MSAAANIELVRRFLMALNDWNFDTIGLILHPEIRYELPYAPAAFPKITEGHAAVMTFLKSIPAFAVEENLYDISVDCLVSDPDELVAEFSSDMKLASGRPYSNKYIARISIRDGKIRRFAEYFDAQPLIVALGGEIWLPDGVG